MQQRVASDVSIEVILLVRENSDVGAEDQGRVESLQTEVDEVNLGELADDPQGKAEDQNQDRVNSFDPSTVKIDDGKSLLEDFLGNDLGN
jgi:hypothetical protein